MTWAFEVDVITPHYQDYYSGSSAPADWLKPNPVMFLTIAEGSTFWFDVCGSDSASVETVKKWLVAATRERGLRAKTGAGYGVLEEGLV